MQEPVAVSNTETLFQEPMEAKDHDNIVTSHWKTTSK